MISAYLCKTYADSFYSNLDVVSKIELDIISLSARGEYVYNFYNPEMVEAFGNNTLNQDMQRILFELKKANYKIDFDFDNQNVVITWG